MAEINMTEVERLFSDAPFIRNLGLRLVSAAAGECRSSLELEERHLQQDGVVHAGVHGTIADHTAGAAAATLLKPGQYILGAEYKINLLRAAQGRTLHCTARVIKAGRTLIIAESEIWCVGETGEKLVSKAMVTLAVAGSAQTVLAGEVLS